MESWPCLRCGVHDEARALDEHPARKPHAGRRSAVEGPDDLDNQADGRRREAPSDPGNANLLQEVPIDLLKASPDGPEYRVDGSEELDEVSFENSLI